MLFLLACAARTPTAAAPPHEVDHPRVATLVFHGDARLVEVTRDVVDVRVELSPNLAAEAGLVDDAVRVPSYTPDHVSALVKRLDADLAALDAMPVASWSLHDRNDVRWLRANAEEARYRLTVERRWTHRPAEWLEPIANTYVALATVAPQRTDLAPALTARLPGVFAELRALMTAPTRRDVDTALGLLDGMDAMLGGNADVRAYRAELAALTGLPEYDVIGPEAYAWRLRHALLLPWTPPELLSLAEKELVRTDARIAELTPRVVPPAPPTPEELAAADALDRDGLMKLYEGVVAENLARLRAMNVLTVPADFPPIRARETPDAVVPFTGDGGSMNPQPPFGPSIGAWWNVEHFRDTWTHEQRLDTVTSARRQQITGMGPYAVHEGVPGHHLQLAITRNNPCPLRAMLGDAPYIEGWALYAEQLFLEGGGFGDSAQAELNVTRSYRGRIRRVFYDVNLETRAWTLQEAADWRAGTPGAAIEPELMRAIQWPTQLIAYFAGKQQILALREEARALPGYTDRAFHDALLGAGPIPVALAREEVLAALGGH